MTGRAPVRKVRAGGISGAAATLAVWLVGLVPGVEVPATAAAAITTLVAAAVAYWVHAEPGEPAPPEPENTGATLNVPARSASPRA